MKLWGTKSFNSPVFIAADVFKIECAFYLLYCYLTNNMKLIYFDYRVVIFIMYLSSLRDNNVIVCCFDNKIELF